MNTSFHKKILIVLAVAVLFGCGALYVGVNYIFQTNKSIADLTHTMSVEVSQRQAQSSTATLVASANPDIATVNNSVLTTDGDVSFIEYIESLARSYNLQVVIDSLSLANDPTLAPNGLDTLEVKAEVKGSWTNVYAFTTRVEALPYSMRVNSVDVVNTQDTTNLDPTITTPAPGPWQEEVDMSVLKKI